MRSGLLALAIFAVGCKEPPKEAAPTATCKTAISGKLVFPPKLPKGGKFNVYVAQDDCLSDNATMLGQTEAGMDGSFSLDVSAKCGSDVSICAGRAEGEGKSTTLYGKAKGVADVKVELEQDKPPHVFPTK